MHLPFIVLICSYTELTCIWKEIQYYRKIHYQSWEFRVKLHVKTDVARVTKLKVISRLC